MPEESHSSSIWSQTLRTPGVWRNGQTLVVPATHHVALHPVMPTSGYSLLAEPVSTLSNIQRIAGLLLGCLVSFVRYELFLLSFHAQ